MSQPNPPPLPFRPPPAPPPRPPFLTHPCPSPPPGPLQCTQFRYNPCHTATRRRVRKARMSVTVQPPSANPRPPLAAAPSPSATAGTFPSAALIVRHPRFLLVFWSAPPRTRRRACSCPGTAALPMLVSRRSPPPGPSGQPPPMRADDTPARRPLSRRRGSDPWVAVRARGEGPPRAACALRRHRGDGPSPPPSRPTAAGGSPFSGPGAAVPRSVRWLEPRRRRRGLSIPSAASWRPRCRAVPKRRDALEVEGPERGPVCVGRCGGGMAGKSGSGPLLSVARLPVPLVGRKGKSEWVAASDELEGNGPQRRPQRRLGRRLEEVVKAVGGSYFRLQMPWGWRPMAAPFSPPRVRHWGRGGPDQTAFRTPPPRTPPPPGTQSCVTRCPPPPPH